MVQKMKLLQKPLLILYLSEEGQQLAAELGYTPIRKGVEAPEGLKTIEELNGYFCRYARII